MTSKSRMRRARWGLLCGAVLVSACGVSGRVAVSPLPGVAVTGTLPGVVVHPGGVSSPVDTAPAALKIPPGHYPSPGLCRIWMPGVPPGRQSPPGRCPDLQNRVPPGAVLVRG